MAIYEFQCKNKKCGRGYEEEASYDESGKYPTVKCPFCKSKLKEKIISSFNFQFAQPEGTGRWNSDSTGHDYRFKHNLPKVMNERMNAELASRSGATPYNPIDDISHGDAFGDVK